MEARKFGLLCLSGFALLGLAGCASSSGGASADLSSQDGEFVSSSEVTPASSESESYTDDADGWTAEQKRLLKAYCGEIIPYSYYFDGEVSVEEIIDEESDYSYLEIKDESTEFSLVTYYMDLEDEGWTASRGYDSDPVQYNSSGTEYVELTKTSNDGKTGYDIIYFFSSAYLDSLGSMVNSGNTIRCYRDLETSRSESSDWTRDDKAIMQNVLAYDLPFMKMSPSYTISKSAINVLAIEDIYVSSLIEEYAKVLESDGFAFNEKLTNYCGYKVLSKTLSDDSSIDILLSYYGGNSFVAYYNAKETEYTSWDNPIIQEAEQATGLTIPSFQYGEGGCYKAYKKSDSYYIYTNDLYSDDTYTSSSKYYENYSLFTLRDPRLLWEETVSFSCINLTDGEQMIGYMLIITPATPTSTFVSSWPEDVINDFTKNTLGVSDIALPSLSDDSIPSTGKQVKYKIYDYETLYKAYCEDIEENTTTYFDFTPTQDQINAKADTLAKENVSISVTMLDSKDQAYEAYEDLLYKMKWYGYYDSDNCLIYEDPKGKLSVTFSDDAWPSLDYLGPTTITIGKGSGTTHREEFYFKDSEIQLIPGEYYDLPAYSLVKTMLPYDVTYSVSGGDGKITVDASGLVSVAEDAIVGTSATISATINVPGEANPRTISVKITVKKNLYYSAERAMDSVLALLKEKGYETTATSDDTPRYMATVNFGTSMTKEELETFVETNLIPEGFEAFGERWRNWNEPVDGSKQSVYYADTMPMIVAFTALKFHIYTQNGDLMLYITTE